MTFCLGNNKNTKAHRMDKARSKTLENIALGCRNHFGAIQQVSHSGRGKEV